MAKSTMFTFRLQNSRKKVVEKMWLSNKKGMSSVYKLVQKLIS